MNHFESTFLQGFVGGDRQLSLPARLPVLIDGAEQEIEANVVLRLLPRKRVVFRGTWQNRSVVVKWFVANRSGDRNVLRELNGYELARSAGVLCPQLLAKCDSICGQFKGLIFELIDEAIELSEAWFSFDVAQKKTMLGEIVRTALHMHNAGGYQEDIHFGNFLLKDNQLYTLDLGSIVVRDRGKVLPPTACLANLGQLAAQLDVAEQGLLDESTEWYFCQRHWVDRKAAREKLLEFTRKAWRVRLRDYLHKARRTCSLTCFEQSGRFLWACRRQWWGDDTQRFLSDPDAYMESGELIKAGNSATVVKTVMQGRPVVIKRYNIKNWRHALSRVWRPTRAYHSWKYAHVLELIGIPSLKPVALLERRLGPLRSTAYFISEWIEAPDLLTIGRQRVLTAEELAALKSVLLQMEKCRLSHGDFKANNLLVDDAKIALIDLDAMRRHWDAYGFWWAFRKDLARLRRNWRTGEPALLQVRGLIREISNLRIQPSACL